MAVRSAWRGSRQRAVRQLADRGGHRNMPDQEPHGPGTNRHVPGQAHTWTGPHDPTCLGVRIVSVPKLPKAPCLCGVQLSTTQLSALAWLPALFGVLQTLVMQNSPHRHSSSRSDLRSRHCRQWTVRWTDWASGLQCPQQFRVFDCHLPQRASGTGGLPATLLAVLPRPWRHAGRLCERLLR